MPRSRPAKFGCRRLGIIIVLTAAAASTLASCARFSQARTGSLRTESLGNDPVFLSVDLPTVVYAHDPKGSTNFILSDVPVEALIDGSATTGQVIHVELLWSPKAGRTPMDESATNVSIHHVILADGEVGVYGGAGFAMPKGKFGSGRVRLTLEDATVRLLESTPEFADPLSPARITGRFTAEHDPLLAHTLRRAVSQHVTNMLGTTLQVQKDSDREKAPRSPGQLVAPSLAQR